MQSAYERTMISWFLHRDVRLQKERPLSACSESGWETYRSQVSPQQCHYLMERGSVHGWEMSSRVDDGRTGALERSRISGPCHLEGFDTRVEIFPG